MEYRKRITLKDGRRCLLRNGTADDARAALDSFNLTHEETDFLLTYPGEGDLTLEDEARYLRERAESDSEIEILAEIDGGVVGTAGIGCVGAKEKLRHRAEFGVSVEQAFWGLGVGRALTEACVECAKAAGYAQLELDVVANNERAIALYRSVGFVEYGRNPRGFQSRQTGWQELVLMRLELDA
ncbi:MAG: GNAT family N-acetyltransferase [Atopobiaceae bacterium]|nr:GNAT family N-acetyltransferase [Atopobiaceae bacterium]